MEHLWATVLKVGPWQMCTAWSSAFCQMSLDTGSQYLDGCQACWQFPGCFWGMDISVFRVCVSARVRATLSLGSQGLLLEWRAAGCTDERMQWPGPGCSRVATVDPDTFLTLGGVFWEMGLARSVKARTSQGVANVLVYLAQP